MLNLYKSNKDIYQDLYNQYKTFTDKKIITLSSTKTANLISIPAINEKYMYRQRNDNLPGDHPQFKSSLNILYISSKPDIEQVY